MSDFAAQLDEFGEEKVAEAEPVSNVNKGMNFWNFFTVSSLDEILLVSYFFNLLF